MLRQRALVTLVLLPIGLVIFWLGGWVFAVAMALVLALAGREYADLFRAGDARPAKALLIVGPALLVLARQAQGLDGTALWVAGLALVAMTWHLVDFERGAPRSGSDFGLTLGGIIYLGVIGAYLVSLRGLPDGLWWLLISLPVVWIGDSAAYFVGRPYGRHKMAPRLSPKKSWEGYAAGVVAAALSGAGLAALYGTVFDVSTHITVPAGLILGLVLGVVTTLGDLGISMMKRELQVKDTGTLLPGHGGVLDRIDSWLWAGVLGYYLALVLAV
jgi:phosphatidate cytidylyltransferase